MSHFSYESALKALELCFENSELTSIEGVLDAAKQAYDFLVGESHHFKESPDFENPIDSMQELTVKNRISICCGDSHPLAKLRIYEDKFGKFNRKLDYLLLEILDPNRPKINKL